ncbi:MAG: sigma-54 dependent transcriptional regulator [Acidobacteriota bacterium]
MDLQKPDGLETRTETSSTGTDGSPLVDAASTLVPGLVIVAHPDHVRIGEEVPLPQLRRGAAVILSRREPSFLPPTSEASPQPLAAAFLSRRGVELRADGAGGILITRGASPIALTVNGARLESQLRLKASDVERGSLCILAGRIALLLQPVPTLRTSGVPRYGLVGHSVAIGRLRREIRAASLLQVPVLLRGETGTGKELVARAVHGARPNPGPYVTVNLGALVPNLAASELFGAVRGAYTGADRKRDGFFRRADGGTLFLDEIGEAPPEVQVMLLRTLETARVQPVGGTDERPVDVRVIAATDADLEEAIGAGQFRPALLHRLSGYEIQVPPLRDRKDDIARLLVHFFVEESRTLGESVSPRELGPWLPAEAVARLVQYRWPGNVRELRNVVRRVAVARHLNAQEDPLPLLDQLLRPPEARADDGAGGGKAEGPMIAPDARPRSAAEVPADELIAALERARWRPGPAAKALGLSRQALYRRIQDHPDLRTAAELSDGEIRTALERHGSPAAAADALRVSLQGFKRRATALGLTAD